jgi:cytochrome d ubiquinol oxidase subunit I
MLRLGVIVAAFVIPVQILAGDQHGLNTLEHQPAKVAAMEGLWNTERGAPVVLFAWPDAKEKRNRFAIELPYGASLILTHKLEGEVKGLNEFPDRQPPVAPVFFAFRVMVGMGVLMLAVSWTATWFTLRREQHPRWLLRTLAAMTFSGWVAVLAGWLVTEIGRQPYLVYGVLTTAEAASSVPASNIAITLIAYFIVYVLLLISYLVVVTQLARAAAGVEPSEPATGELQPTGTVY